MFFPPVNNTLYNISFLSLCFLHVCINITLKYQNWVSTNAQTLTGEREDRANGASGTLVSAHHKLDFVQHTQVTWPEP